MERAHPAWSDEDSGQRTDEQETEAVQGLGGAAVGYLGVWVRRASIKVEEPDTPGVELEFREYNCH